MSAAHSTEVWKAIDGWDGYEVSTQGRVRSFLFKCKGARVAYSIGRTPKVLAQSILKVSRYRVVTLCAGKGKRKPFLVHRLVLTTFVGPCPPKMEACHWDSDKANNCLTNLRWDTRKKNHADKIRHGTLLMGSSHYNAKLTESDVKTIKRLVAKGRTSQELADQFGVTRGCICLIMCNHNWKHVSPD